ncbi:hypothetical protein F5B22DRAFT_616708 [Xylaria bambusicola]|uniref:uncharacterized protein n=1 Tax=Xylaria bambusicola TaxID=326684 RepID=UPI002008892E|nr:uncharacterized protein F5B22DRAFT_616708 [Xylaria bambusicola]KAI0509540.1 hypothetical protein F5B22DRAFT_616708 [Xylaria bambusicola]
MAPLSEEELARDQAPQLLAIFIIFTVLPLIAVTLRIVARRVTHQKIGLDDWLIFVAVALCIVQLAFLIEAILNGLGKHIQVVPPASIAPYLMYTYLSELYYAIDVTLIKLSILTLYLRLFNVNRHFKNACYAMMVFVLAWGIAVLFTTIFQCQPVTAAWDKTIPDFKCFSLSAFVIGSNVPNILADAVIIALPLPLLWSLKLSTTRKLGLIALFLVAAITTVISLLRVIFNAKINTMDATWNFITVAILSTVEVNVGVTCACMPVIYPLFRVFVDRRIVSSKSQTGSKDGSYVYGRQSSRTRQRLGSSDREQSDTSQLWSASGGVHNSSKEGDEIPMNRIMVTRDLSVWPPPVE